MSILDKYRNKINAIPYTFEHWCDYDYTILNTIRKCRMSGKGDKSYNDAIIMADTETSKKVPDTVCHNHVVAWTVSVRACHHNICTLWGHRPDTLVECMDRVHRYMHEEAVTVMYVFNLPFDYVFLRRFMFVRWGEPKSQLNVKPHYPLFCRFSNNITIKDALILAQRKLEKWANDLCVEHRKATGKWDYAKIRNQKEAYIPDELTYIENDTLAGVECIDATMTMLNKHIYSMPYTATGIVRERIRSAGKPNKAHIRFEAIALTWEQLQLAEKAYHGGYAHANRHYLDTTVTGLIRSFDFASSYPYEMLTRPVPMGRFFSTRDCKLSDITGNDNKYAFMCKVIMAGIKIKNDAIVMPVLQMSKCIKTVNAVTDNGRILSADYAVIYLNDLDIRLITMQYDIERHICKEVICATKGLLPKWFRDLVFELFTDKTQLKGGDPVLYSIAKAMLNSLYGCCVQHPVQNDIIENYETGEYSRKDADLEDKYNRWVKRFNSVLPYQWGVYITSGAMLSLHELGKHCGIWLYSDTDSVYGMKWDMEGVARYNAMRIRRLKECGYGGVEHNGRLYYPGVAEHDPEADVYSEFRTVGAKRYCYRSMSDGKLHITVAGVPKKTGAACLNDDIGTFTTGLKFFGDVTGKLTHTYFYNDIYTDSEGNITGDSIDLSPCDYLLSAETEIEWDDIGYDITEVKNYALL